MAEPGLDSPSLQTPIASSSNEIEITDEACVK